MNRIGTYAGVFIVAAVVMQLMIFDSMRLSVFFNPLAYIAFIVLLPMNTKPIAVLLLGLFTGLFIDFFEGTGGLHTAVTLMTAYTRRYVMMATIGRDFEEDVAMPSPGSLGDGKFMRYAVPVVFLHCLVFFSLEALTWRNYHLVLLKTSISGIVTLISVWMVSLLFTIRSHRKA